MLSYLLQKYKENVYNYEHILNDFYLALGLKMVFGQQAVELSVFLAIFRMKAD